MSSTKFEQCYFAMRVVEEGGKYIIQSSILGGSTHEFTTDDETHAKGIYATLETFYLAALEKIHEQMREIHSDMMDNSDRNQGSGPRILDTE